MSNVAKQEILEAKHPFAQTSTIAPFWSKGSILEQRMKRCEKQPDFGVFDCVEVMGGILMCDIMCRWNSPRFSDPRNTAICNLHWVILNVVSLQLVKYLIF